MRWLLSLVFLASVLGVPSELRVSVEAAGAQGTVQMAVPDYGDEVPSQASEHEQSPDDLCPAPLVAPAEQSPHGAGACWRRGGEPDGVDGSVPVPPPIA